MGRTLHSSQSKALCMEPRPDLGNHPRKKARDLMPLRHRSAPKEELQGRLFLADIGGPVRGVQLPCVRQAHEEAELRGVLGRSLPPEGSSSTLAWGSALGFRVGAAPLLPASNPGGHAMLSSDAIGRGPAPMEAGCFAPPGGWRPCPGSSLVAQQQQVRIHVGPIHFGLTVCFW